MSTELMSQEITEIIKERIDNFEKLEIRNNSTVCEVPLVDGTSFPIMNCASGVEPTGITIAGEFTRDSLMEHIRNNTTVEPLTLHSKFNTKVMASCLSSKYELTLDDEYPNFKDEEVYGEMHNCPPAGRSQKSHNFFMSLNKKGK